MLGFLTRKRTDSGETISTVKLLAYLKMQTEAFEGSQTDASYVEGWRKCAEQIAKDVRDCVPDRFF